VRPKKWVVAGIRARLISWRERLGKIVALATACLSVLFVALAKFRVKPVPISIEQGKAMIPVEIEGLRILPNHPVPSPEVEQAMKEHLKIFLKDSKIDSDDAQLQLGYGK
jgi:hypothetical protein